MHIVSCTYTLFLKNVDLFLRERERESMHVQAGKGQKRGQRESQAGSTLSMESDMRLDLMTMRL